MQKNLFQEMNVPGILFFVLPFFDSINDVLFGKKHGKFPEIGYFAISDYLLNNDALG